MTVTDDISGLAGKIDPAFYATFPHDGLTLSTDHSTITWAVPTILAGGADATVSYTVTVKSDAWNVTLRNHATPVDITGSCPGANDCITTHTTPKRPLLTLVKKVENGISEPVAKTAWDLSADPTEGATVSGLGGFGPQGVDPDTYSLGEELVGPGVDADDWTDSGWTCTNKGVPMSLTASGTEVTLVPNDDVTCTITNTREGEFTVAKSSTTTMPFLPGGTITYTLKATHTEGVSPTNVVLHDDLTAVMAHANSFALPRRAWAPRCVRRPRVSRARSTGRSRPCRARAPSPSRSRPTTTRGTRAS